MLAHCAYDGGKKARSPGRARRKPLKPLRRECRNDFGEPVATTLVCFFHFARGAMGAAGTRHSLRPLFFGAHDSFTTRTQLACGNAKLCLLPLPACGERVGVRGTLVRLGLGESPSPDHFVIDLSPQAGRGDSNGSCLAV